MNYWGGPIAFAGFGAAENKGIVFGGFSHNIDTLECWTEGASLRGVGVPYRFWDLLHDSHILRNFFS